MSDAVVVNKLGKRFRRFHSDRPWTLHEALLRGFGKLAPADCFWGVRDVSFRVAAGQMVGVIGRNGAGKSTLLRLIGGVGKADRGSIQVHGRIGALLNLGASFHPDLTARENLFINGVIGGLTRSEVALRVPEIIAFSELEQYIDSPLRAYSTGMQMRLAFAIAVHSQPDVLLIDEVLAVGDVAFQRKCMERIMRLKSDGCAIILVSHEAALVADICDEVVWLEHGRLAGHGAPRVVVEKYLSEIGEGALSEPEERGIEEEEPAAVTGPPLLPSVQILDVNLTLPGNSHSDEISSGSPLNLEIVYDAAQRVHTLNFRVYIYRDDGMSCCDFRTEASGSTLFDVAGEGKVVLQVERVDLNGGTYHIDVAAFEHDAERCYDYRKRVASLVSIPEATGIGVLRPPHRWQTNQRSAVSSTKPSAVKS